VFKRYSADRAQSHCLSDYHGIGIGIDTASDTALINRHLNSKCFHAIGSFVHPISPMPSASRHVREPSPFTMT
jgi:hypothetical protein